MIRIGIIGYDTSHVVAFTRLLHDTADPFHIPGGRVVMGYPSFSPDVHSSVSRVEGFTQEMAGFGVALAASVEEVVDQADAILLLSVDGRRHLAEVKPVLEARKPVFIDKPLAANYRDAAAIVRLAQENNCSLFSSSSLRFDAHIISLKADATLGNILACDAFSPASLDASNPGLFWYGIHGVEMLYTFMGRGCQKVSCHSTEGYDVVVGTWCEDRSGTLRGLRRGANDYGVTVFGEKKVGHMLYSREIPIYSQLLKEIMVFCQSSQAPVPVAETLEMMAFMQAALVSQQENREVGLHEITAEA
ncbi:MAG: Gfo/Idh/MocA family oxidoreductase [Abitibacteriaceae bacterium]|nr:Gfo/Idh/MocA family oxidoreductase [Abditibacteriaceae bacterium]MBV9864342.1 Gfo/Idh/MocA family oxidoreductase [Abditibacteriaceae bacterium]